MKMILIALLFNSSLLWGHGMNALGPNQGYIKMPGPFHTELVLINQSTVRVFLLDMKNENPTIENSSVKLRYKFKKLSLQFKCRSNEKYFECHSSKAFDKDNGELFLLASRNGKTGTETSYTLPLKLE